MAVSPHFQTELQVVDGTKSFSYDSAASGYEFWEWSYSGSGSVYTVLGGSELACEHGAGHLMDRLGFRWYTPNTQFWIRPASINMGLTATKQKFWMPANYWAVAYSHRWHAPHSSSDTSLMNALSKWNTLQGLSATAYPAGHRWSSLINTEPSKTWFNANPQFKRSLNGTGSANSMSFPLNTLTVGEIETLAQICASQLLYERGLDTTNDFYKYDRTNFDATDGDSLSSDYVFPFAKQVVDLVRSGTPAVGPHPSRTGRPNAQLGVYAYAGHRLAPTASVKPGIYTQVALGFNDTPYTLPQLMLLHSQKADHVLMREYLDVQAWNNSQPFHPRSKAGYFDKYDEYKAGGAFGGHSETSANWLVNIVMARTYVKKLRTGVTDWTGSLNEIMRDLFSDDPAVKELYELWANKFQSYHKFTLKRSFELVTAMQDRWYKTYFKQYLVVLYEFLTLPKKLATTDPNWNTAADPFPAAHAKMCAHLTAMRDLDIIHSWAFLRRWANSYTKSDYPNNYLFASLPVISGGLNLPNTPTWYFSPYLPTDQDFSDYYVQLEADTFRAPDLDSDDLVWMQGITPRASGGSNSSNFKIQDTPASFKVIGPSVVTVTGQEAVYDEETGDFLYYQPVGSSTPYPAGISFFQTTGDVTVTWTGGRVFMEWIPRTRREPGLTGESYLYIPGRCAGAVTIEAESRLKVIDQNGQFEVVPPSNPAYVSPANLGPGQIQIVDGQTSGFTTVVNSNKYVSTQASEALLPRVIAEEDFGSLVRVQFG